MKLNIQRVIIFAVLILLLIAAGMYLFLENRQNGQSALPKGLTTAPIVRDTLITKVGSTGKARANQIIQLQWQTTGTVGQVNVKDLDRVIRGDILLELDPESLQPSILKAIEELPAAQRELDNLQISDIKRTQAREDLAQAQIAFKNAKDTRELKNQRNTTDANLESAYAAYLQAKSNLETVETFFSFLQDQPEDDLARAQVTAQLSLARKNYDWATWNYQWAQNKPLPEDVQIAEANLKVAESKLADAQRNWEKVKDNPDPDDIISAKSTVDALKQQIDLTKITAPIMGTVSDSKQLIGDMVKAGQVALTLVDTSRMFLEISISEVDINKVRIGQEVTFVFDAVPDKSFQGIVSEINTVGVSDQEIIYYTVTCEINNFDYSIKPGMTAAASIQENKAENVVTIPNEAIFQTGSQKSVYIVQNNSLRLIPVELGLISDRFSELRSGELHEGDSIVTNPKSIPTPGTGK